MKLIESSWNLALSPSYYGFHLTQITGRLLYARHRAIEEGFPTGIGLKMEPVVFPKAVLKIESV